MKNKDIITILEILTRLDYIKIKLDENQKVQEIIAKRLAKYGR